MAAKLTITAKSCIIYLRVREISNHTDEREPHQMHNAGVNNIRIQTLAIQNGADSMQHINQT